MNFKSLPFIAAAALLSSGVFAQVPANDECANAISIQSSIGLAIGVTDTIGPYDNTNATVSAGDPATGFECFGEPDGSGTAPTIENTLWFTFTGDGGKYFIETGDGPGVTNYIDDGDTQIAIYTGACGALVPFACNEDGPSATATTYPAGLTFNTNPGEVYYMMIDGFNFNGAISMGEFLIFITQQATISCTDPTVTLGTYSANKTFVCPGDTVRFDISGVITPTVGVWSGLGWVISSADISGSTDPLNDPSLVATYQIQSPAPSTSFRLLINNGALIGGPVPYGTYWWTPIIFGNAVAINTPTTFMSDLMLDPACTITGNSISVDVLAPGDPLCNVGIADLQANGFGITNIYPVPVNNELNFNLNTVENGNVEISVKDNLGREVISDIVLVNSGEQRLTYNVAQLESGVYFITASSGTSVSVSRFMKQ